MQAKMTYAGKKFPVTETYLSYTPLPGGELRISAYVTACSGDDRIEVSATGAIVPGSSLRELPGVRCDLSTPRPIGAGEGDYLPDTNVCVHEHEAIERGRLHIVSVDGDQISFEITGDTVDQLGTSRDGLAPFALRCSAIAEFTPFEAVTRGYVAPWDEAGPTAEELSAAMHVCAQDLSEQLSREQWFEHRAFHAVKVAVRVEEKPSERFHFEARPTDYKTDEVCIVFAGHELRPLDVTARASLMSTRIREALQALDRGSRPVAAAAPRDELPQIVKDVLDRWFASAPTHRRGDREWLEATRERLLSSDAGELNWLSVAVAVELDRLREAGTISAPFHTAMDAVMWACTEYSLDSNSWRVRAIPQIVDLGLLGQADAANWSMVLREVASDSAAEPHASLDRVEQSARSASAGAATELALAATAHLRQAVARTTVAPPSILGEFPK